MNTAEKILNRLAQALGTTKDIELAQVLRIKHNTISSWKKRDAVPYKVCVDVAKRENISLNWLLLGDGPMRRQQETGEKYFTGPATTIEKINKNVKELSETQRLRILLETEEMKDQKNKLDKMEEEMKRERAMFFCLRSISENSHPITADEKYIAESAAHTPKFCFKCGENLKAGERIIEITAAACIPPAWMHEKCVPTLSVAFALLSASHGDVNTLPGEKLNGCTRHGKTVIHRDKTCWCTHAKCINSPNGSSSPKR